MEAEKVKELIKQFEQKRTAFLKLKLHEAVNWEKYSMMSISHHSTAIEGSSLTEMESRILLDEGATPQGKPLEHSLMEKDHYLAMCFIAGEAKAKKTLSPDFIRAVSSRVMKNTGGPVSSPGGNFDSSKGDFRKVAVFAGTRYFPSYDKVEGMVQDLCDELTRKIDTVSNTEDIYNLAFDFHFKLVSIHPFADGNGRVSRLMMNFIILYHGQTPAILHKEDRLEYINALEESRNIEIILPIRRFLYAQQVKYYDREIQKYNSSNKGISLSLFM
jgi:Fic family protein